MQDRAGILVMSRQKLKTIEQHAEETYPNEGCGALLGRVSGEQNVVEEVVRCANVRASSRTRYEINPRELVRIQREARQQGQEIIGFYHSHPDHPAMWSRTDLAEAHWIGCSYVIVSVNEGKAVEVKSYRLAGRVEEDKRFEAEEIGESGTDQVTR